MSRKASHAGSWYDDKGKSLAKQLRGWLDEVKVSVEGVPRAIISPHAGYSYSGPTAAFAYKHIVPKQIKRVFILGPSHHYSTRGCELSQCSVYETPIENLVVDQELIAKLHKTGVFGKMSQSVDEAEHSIEMQLPILAEVMKGCSFKVIPVLVGSLSPEKEKEYGGIFAPYLQDPDNLFIISSDFCHWGKRFRYTYYDKTKGKIWESIQALDQAGMKIIEAQDASGFTEYEDTYENTICGQHPISVFLQALKASSQQFQVQFVRYSQSEKCTSNDDSSVSYAAAVAIPEKTQKK